MLLQLQVKAETNKQINGQLISTPLQHNNKRSCQHTWCDAALATSTCTQAAVTGSEKNPYSIKKQRRFGRLKAKQCVDDYMHMHIHTHQCPSIDHT